MSASGPRILVDTSVFCRAVLFRPYKGTSLVQLLSRIWEECFTFVMSERLREEYVDSLVREGYGSSLSVHRFIEALGGKVLWVSIPDGDIEEFLRRNPKLRRIESDVPHLLAAARAGARMVLFIDEGVESRSGVVKRALGLDVVNPSGFADLPAMERCTSERMPFPFR